MKTKTLSFIIASVFAFVFLVSVASAATIFSDNFDDSNLDGWIANDWTNSGSYAESTNTENANFSKVISTSDYDSIVVKYDRQLGVDWDSTDFFKVSWTTDGSTFNVLEEITGNSTDALPNDSDFVSKSFSLPSLAEDNSNFEIKIECSTSASTEFCKLDNFVVEGTEIEEEPLTCDYSQGSLRVSIEDITVVSGFGDDDEWLPFDEIEVEIEIENKNDDEKIKDVELEWGLWSQETNEWVIDLDDIDEFDISKDDSETTTIDFKLDEKDMDVDLEDLEDGDYTLYVRAKGEEQEDPEFNVCSIDSAEVQLFLEDDFVILNDIEVLPEIVQCDSSIHITADVWNMGGDDQEDVIVVIYNSQLGLSEDVTIGDIDAFDSESFDFSFELPEDVEEKMYYLDVKVYDEDHDIYENDYDDQESFFSVPLKVEGGCFIAEASVNAVLESGGKAGQPLVVKATIINTGDKSTTYMLNAAAYTEWASAANLDKSTIILEAGESEDVFLTFDVKKEALGDYLFNVEVLSENELVVSKPVQVTISKKGLGITGGAILGDDWYLWGIGALNVILVILIIVIAIRIARK